LQRMVPAPGHWRRAMRMVNSYDKSIVTEYY
jgi:hypothetical protein